MKDQSTLNRAAQVLRMVNYERPADEALRMVNAENRRWSPEERRKLVRAVFSTYRWLQWLERRESLQVQVEQALELQARFDEKPASIKVQALAARAVPAWLAEEMELAPDYLRQLQRDPALWIRPRLGCEREVENALDDCYGVEVAIPASGRHFTACRYNGTKDLFRTTAFQEGLFEIQDLASQWVGHVCAPKPGETWWDACAGEGGKTLHLADLMQGKGLIWATDRSERRLERLRERSARAKVFNFRGAAWDGSTKLPTKTLFDGILVDAPCSGVGTWQRNPHARWSTTPDDVRELAVVQRRLLDNVAASLKPGGRLVYSVCTLTRSETTAIVKAFSEAHPQLVPGYSGFLMPQQHDSNGMYLAIWTKK
jgi:16S rRNA (cytosine967-C5)-methyltransferase